MVVRRNSLALSIFSGLSTSYDSVVQMMTFGQDKAWKGRLLEKLELRRGARVLDVGCGTGVLEETPALEASEVVGVDLTGGMVRLAQAKSLRPVLMLGLADAEHLPFRDGSFDAVVSCYVPKYCDTTRLAEELGRVLKRGGRLAVYDFTRPHGLLAPLLGYYIYGVLPTMGWIVGPLDPPLAFTCRVLPRLIKSTTWKTEMERALAEGSGGLVRMAVEEMSGGVVTLLWASKE